MTNETEIEPNEKTEMEVTDPPPPPNLEEEKEEVVKEEKEIEETQIEQIHSTVNEPAIPTVEPIPDTDQSMTENNQPQIEPEKPAKPEIEKMPEVEPEVAKPEMVQPAAESNIRNGAKEQKQETTKDETDLQPDLLKFNLEDLTDEALNIANKLNVTSLKKLVFFDQEGVAGLPDNNKDAGSAEVEEVVTMPAYEEYNFLESEAELDPHFNYEFVNSAIKDEIDTPEVALPEPEVPVEKIEKKVVKVPKVVPVVPVVTPVAKMERKRSREHPTPEEPKKGKEIGEKQNEEKQEETVKQSHSAPAVSPVNTVAPVKQPVPMSWASIAKKTKSE